MTVERQPVVNMMQDRQRQRQTETETNKQTDIHSRVREGREKRHAMFLPLRELRARKETSFRSSHLLRLRSMARST